MEGRNATTNYIDAHCTVFDYIYGKVDIIDSIICLEDSGKSIATVYKRTCCDKVF